jgi:hypothetical protein
MGDKRKAYKILVGKPEGMRPCGRTRRIWENNIEMYVKQREWEVMDCIYLAQYMHQWRVLANTVMKLRVP